MTMTLEQAVRLARHRKRRINAVSADEMATWVVDCNRAIDVVIAHAEATVKARSEEPEALRLIREHRSDSPIMQVALAHIDTQNARVAELERKLHDETVLLNEAMRQRAEWKADCKSLRAQVERVRGLDSHLASDGRTLFVWHDELMFALNSTTEPISPTTNTPSLTFETAWVVYSQSQSAWLGPERIGYASSLTEAGAYTEDEARRIEREASPPDLTVLRLADVWANGDWSRWPLPRNVTALVMSRGTSTQPLVCGVVVDDAMGDRYLAVWHGPGGSIRAALAAALSTASTVPLASSTPERWAAEADETHPRGLFAMRKRSETYCIPLFRALTPTTEPTNAKA